MRPYSPGGPLIAFATARKGSIPRTPSGHRLRLGLPGYLIPFAPLAFAPQRQVLARTLPSPSVFLRISTHFTTTPGIPCPSLTLKSRRLLNTLPVKPGAVTQNARHRLRALYAQSLRTTLAPYVLPRLLARSEPGLIPLVPSLLVPKKSSLQPEGRLPARGVARSGFPPLPKIPHCCPP